MVRTPAMCLVDPLNGGDRSPPSPAAEAEEGGGFRVAPFSLLLLLLLTIWLLAQEAQFAEVPSLEAEAGTRLLLPADPWVWSHPLPLLS